MLTLDHLNSRASTSSVQSATSDITEDVGTLLFLSKQQFTARASGTSCQRAAHGVLCTLQSCVPECQTDIVLSPTLQSVCGLFKTGKQDVPMRLSSAFLPSNSHAQQQTVIPGWEKGSRALCTKGRAVWCMAMRGMALIRASCTFACSTFSASDFAPERKEGSANSIHSSSCSTLSPLIAQQH